MLPCNGLLAPFHTSAGHRGNSALTAGPMLVFSLTWKLSPAVGCIHTQPESSTSLIRHTRGIPQAICYSRALLLLRCNSETSFCSPDYKLLNSKLLVISFVHFSMNLMLLLQNNDLNKFKHKYVHYINMIIHVTTELTSSSLLRSLSHLLTLQYLRPMITHSQTQKQKLILLNHSADTSG